MNEHSEATEVRLQARINELQARNTELENERRMWKARCESKRLLLEALIEGAEASYLKRDKVSDEVFAQLETSVMKRIHEVMVRNDLLEIDAWTMTTQLAKDFLKRAKEVQDAEYPSNEKWGDMADDFINDFIEQFADLFKDK